MDINLNLGLTRGIIDECRGRGLLRNQVAYVLATAYHESAYTMRPIKETVMAHHKDKFPSDGVVIGRLNRWYNTKKPNVTPYWRDGWFGRGLVQITHEDNYKRVGQAIGVDLVADPSVALDDMVAIDILVTGMVDGLFTGKRLDNYVTLQKSDFVGARRIVNGTDKDDEIAAIATSYDAVLLADGYGVEPDKPEPKPRMESTTLKAVVAAAVSGGGSVVAVIPDLDPTAQVILAAGVFVTGLALAWIWRERSKKLAVGI